jgi:hypothetical protein
MFEHLSPDLLCDLDRAVGDAIDRVRHGECAQAAVSLAFSVKSDDDMKPIVEYAHKHTTTRKGNWMPSTHPRLPITER